MVAMVSEVVAALGQVVQPLPDQAVEAHDKQAHQTDAKADARPVAQAGGGGDEGPQAIGTEITSLTPRRPRSLRWEMNAGWKASVSLLAAFRARSTRRPSRLTPGSPPIAMPAVGPTA